MAKGIFEVLLHASKQDTFDDKVNYLRSNDSFALRTVLQGCYHPAVKFLLPEGDPPYQVNDPVSVETRLHSLIKKVDLFIEGGRPVATQSKREMLFIEILESVHPEDAKILLRMKDKKDPFPGITQDLAHAAFPDVIPAPVAPVQESVSPSVQALVEEFATKKKSAKKKKMVDAE